jgi:hypothetical protein
LASCASCSSDPLLTNAAEQGVAADHRSLSPIDLGCRLAANWVGRIGSSQRCCWRLNADPSASAACAEERKLLPGEQYNGNCTQRYAARSQRPG